MPIRPIEVDVRADTRAFRRSTQATGVQLRGLGRDAQTAAVGVGALAGAFGSLLAATVLVRGLSTVSREAAELGDELANLAAATDLSVEALQVYRRAFERGGASVAQFQGGIARLGLGLSQAREGNALLRADFAALNVTDLSDVEGALARIIEGVNPDNFQDLRPTLRRVFGDDAVRTFAATLQATPDDIDAIRESMTLLGTESVAALSGLNAELLQIQTEVRTNIALAVADNVEQVGLLARTWGDVKVQVIEVAAAGTRLQEGLSGFFASIADIVLNRFGTSVAELEGDMRGVGEAAADANAAIAPLGPTLEQVGEAVAPTTAELAALKAELRELAVAQVEVDQALLEGTAGFGAQQAEAEALRDHIASVREAYEDLLATGSRGVAIQVIDPSFGDQITQFADGTKVIAEASREATEIGRAAFDSFFDSVDTSLTSLIDGLIDGSASLRDILGNLAKSVLDIFVSLGLSRLRGAAAGSSLFSGILSAGGPANALAGPTAGLASARAGQGLALTIVNDWKVDSTDAAGVRAAFAELQPQIDAQTVQSVQRLMSQNSTLRRQFKRTR